LYVEDHVQALVLIVEQGRVGQRYNIGGNSERRNIDVVRALMQAMERAGARQDTEALITFVADRPGHDWRYAVDTRKIESELGWRPSVAFEDGLERTVAWYLANESWWRPAKARLMNCRDDR
jgi:dTDP-glucose 4,6-dehydratase